jgi:hypothetical protein
MMKKKTGRFARVALPVLAMALAFSATASAAGETEPNDSLTAASATSLGEFNWGVVSGSDVNDYWKLTDASYGTHTLYGNSGTAMEVRNSSGSLLAYKPAGTMSVSFFGGGTLYVVASFYSSTAYNYSFSVN